MTLCAHGRLEQGMDYLVRQRRVVTGVAAAFGGARRGETLCRGNIREVRYEKGAFVPDEAPLCVDSIFDLASVTKLFTCIAVLQLVEAGKLALDTPMGRCDRRFLHIPEVTIEEMLSFRAALETEARLDEQPAAEAEKLLFSIRRGPDPVRRFYTDMGAMVLPYAVEAAADQTFSDYLAEHIFSPLGMTRTFAHVPEALLGETVCCNCERRAFNGRFWLDLDCPAGTVHDPKARILGREGRAPCGHAGLFSSLADMTRLAHGLLEGALLSRNTLLSIGVNRTGRRLPGGGYSQYHGYLCYAKHPVQTFSEVPACFGTRTIALNGYTGNHFSIDPERNQYMILLANRVHNRVTAATGNGRANPDDTTETVLWDDGRRYVLSQNFVYMKDPYLKNPIGELLEAY